MRVQERPVSDIGGRFAGGSRGHAIFGRNAAHGREDLLSRAVIRIKAEILKTEKAS
jgi:hypothetical protein